MKGKAVNILVILIISLSIISSASAQGENDTKEKVVKTPPPEKKDCPSEEACKLWEEFKEKYGKNWRVRWHESTGTPRMIFGYHYPMGMGNASNADKAKEIAWKFISDNKDFLKVDLSQLELTRVVEGNLDWGVDYKQLYNEIPVKGGRVGITVSKEGEILVAGSYFYPNISVSTTPEISRDEAIDIAKEKMNVISPVVQNVSLVIFPHESDDTITYHLTWNVRLFSLEPLQGKAYAVDAITGDIIKEGDWLRTGGISNPEKTRIIKGLVFEKLKENLLWIVGGAIIAFVLLLKIRRRSK